MARARHFVQSAADRASALGERVSKVDASDGLLFVFIWIGLAFCALYILGRHSLATRRPRALRDAPPWLRERLKLPRRLTPIGVPYNHTRGGFHGTSNDHDRSSPRGAA
jgi:hypothetical protein